VKLTSAFLVVICLLSHNTAFGQADSVILTNNQISALVQSNGTMFSQKDGLPLNHFASSDQTHLIRYSGSWMVGVVGDTVYANRNSDASTPQLWPGPIDTVTNLPKSAVEWSKVWPITRADVETHRASYMDEGYLVPQSVGLWPAKHSDINISAFMAPYIDWNENGIYDPENGDYPSFEGDYACYFIANDLFGENVFPQANKIGVEIQGLVYAYDRSDLGSTIFVKLYLINRSGNDYAPFYFGQYIDYQLGNPNDNVVATDVNRNMIYGYNGDNDDENGFGTSIPAVGCLFLNSPIKASSLFVDGDSLSGLPTTEKQMLEIISGNWKNGSPKYGVGNGAAGTSNQITPFVYAKSTDPNVGHLNWSDESSGVPIGTRKMVGVVDFKDFKSKTYKRIDLAFVFAQDENDVESVLQMQADNAIKFFNSTLGQSYIPRNSTLKVYPNPFVIGLDKAFYINALSVQLLNDMGQIVADLVPVDNQENKFSIPCSEKLSSGVYYLKAVEPDSLSFIKVILINN
jgi:hypothetical protein